MACSRLSEEEMAGRIKRFGLNFNFHAAEAGSWVRFLRASRLHAIHQNIRVMYHALIAWPNFDGFEPAGFIYRSGKDKIPVLVATAGRELVRFIGLDDQ